MMIAGLAGCASNKDEAGRRPDVFELSSAAAELKISEKIMTDSMRDPQQGHPDVAALARALALGVTVKDLMCALIRKAGIMPPKGGKRI